MVLQEPRAEFVPIDLRMSVVTESACPSWETQTPIGGGQRCIGTQIEATVCTDWSNEIPFGDTDN